MITSGNSPVINFWSLPAQVFEHAPQASKGPTSIVPMAVIGPNLIEQQIWTPPGSGSSSTQRELSHCLVHPKDQMPRQLVWTRVVLTPLGSWHNLPARFTALAVRFLNVPSRRKRPAVLSTPRSRRTSRGHGPWKPIQNPRMQTPQGSFQESTTQKKPSPNQWPAASLVQQRSTLDCKPLRIITTKVKNQVVSKATKVSMGPPGLQKGHKHALASATLQWTSLQRSPFGGNEVAALKLGHG